MQVVPILLNHITVTLTMPFKFAIACIGLFNVGVVWIEQSITKKMDLELQLRLGQEETNAQGNFKSSLD